MSDTEITDMNSTRNIAIRVRGFLGLLNEDEVAAVLRLESTGTLATWRSQGTGPQSVKLGKRVFYTQNSLVTWVNQKIAEQNPVEQQKAAA